MIDDNMGYTGKQRNKDSLPSKCAALKPNETIVLLTEDIQNYRKQMSQLKITNHIEKSIEHGKCEVTINGQKYTGFYIYKPEQKILDKEPSLTYGFKPRTLVNLKGQKTAKIRFKLERVICPNCITSSNIKNFMWTEMLCPECELTIPKDEWLMLKVKART